MPTVNEVVVTGNDDGTLREEIWYGEYDSGELDKTHARIRTGVATDEAGMGGLDTHERRRTAYARFQTVDIPQGATIDSAKLQFKFHSTTNGTGNSVLIQGENVDDAAQPTSISDFQGKARTDASVTWTYGSYSAGTYYDTPELKTIIQEIVNRAGWAADNDMQFFLKGNSHNSDTNWMLQWKSYNSGSSNAPKLVITYTLGVSFTPNAAIAVANAAGPGFNLSIQGIQASAVSNAATGNIKETHTPAIASAETQATLGEIKITFTPASANAVASATRPSDGNTPDPASAVARALTTYILHTPAAAGADTGLAGLFIQKGFTLTPTAGSSATAAALLDPRLSSFSITTAAGSSEATAVHSAIIITLAPISKMVSIVNNYEGIIVYQLSSGDIAYVKGMGLTTPALPEANSITNMTHVSNTYDGTLIYQDATGTIKRVDGYGLTESSGL